MKDTKLQTAQEAQRELRKMFSELNERMWDGYFPTENDWIDIFDEACDIVEPLSQPRQLDRFNKRFFQTLSAFPHKGQKHIRSSIVQGMFERKLRRYIERRTLKILKEERASLS